MKSTCLTLKAVFAVLAIGVFSGCGATYAQVDGTLDGQPFAVLDTNPVTREVIALNDFYLVIAEPDGDRLRMVTIDLQGVKDGETEYRVGETARVEVSDGELVEDLRADGVPLISSRNPTTSQATDGVVMLDQTDDTRRGYFTVGLSDGGQLEGSFDLMRSR